MIETETLFFLCSSSFQFLLPNEYIRDSVWVVAIRRSARSSVLFASAIFPAAYRMFEVLFFLFIVKQFSLRAYTAISSNPKSMPFYKESFGIKYPKNVDMNLKKDTKINQDIVAESLQSYMNENILSNNNHHHDIVPLARISLTLSRHFSLLYIAFGRSSGLHPVSSHSCCIYVQAGLPSFAWPYAESIGVHHLWRRPCFSSSVLHVWYV